GPGATSSASRAPGRWSSAGSWRAKARTASGLSSHSGEMSRGTREPRDLSPLFRPASIAVIGATGDAAHVRGRITAQLLNCGYPGRIFLVSQRGGEIQGRATFPSIAAVPERVDLALVAIPADAVPGVL